MAASEISKLESREQNICQSRTASSGNIQYMPDGVAAFDNWPDWAPIMLLVMPRKHIPQKELWWSGTTAKVGTVPMRLGEELCPDGFHVLSNIGPDAPQTQKLAYLHVNGGATLWGLTHKG